MVVFMCDVKLIHCEVPPLTLKAVFFSVFTQPKLKDSLRSLLSCLPD
jgi:hypothetical protein